MPQFQFEILDDTDEASLVKDMNTAAEQGGDLAAFTVVIDPQTSKPRFLAVMKRPVATSSAVKTS